MAHQVVRPFLVILALGLMAVVNCARASDGQRRYVSSKRIRYARTTDGKSTLACERSRLRSVWWFSALVSLGFPKAISHS